MREIEIEVMKLNDMKDDEWKKELRDLLIASLNAYSTGQAKYWEEIGNYYLNIAPHSLYKYYSDKLRNLNTVKNNTMWYSAPSFFNDAFDSDFSVDKKAIFKDFSEYYSVGRTIRMGSNEWKNMMSFTTQKIKSFRNELENLRHTTGISCLSESCDSNLMWAHYANCNRGICVEYNLLEINKQLQFTPVPVIYSTEGACLKSIDPENADIEAIRFLISTVSSKSEDWAYEKEWRIIRDNGSCGDAWDSQKHGALLPMIEPSSIILGCKAEGDFEKQVREYCESHKINLFKMEQDHESFRLVKQPLLHFDA